MSCMEVCHIWRWLQCLRSFYRKTFKQQSDASELVQHFCWKHCTWFQEQWICLWLQRVWRLVGLKGRTTVNSDWKKEAYSDWSCFLALSQISKGLEPEKSLIDMEKLGGKQWSRLRFFKLRATGSLSLEGYISSRRLMTSSVLMSVLNVS